MISSRFPIPHVEGEPLDFARFCASRADVSVERLAQILGLDPQDISEDRDDRAVIWAEAVYALVEPAGRIVLPRELWNDTASTWVQANIIAAEIYEELTGERVAGAESTAAARRIGAEDEVRRARCALDVAQAVLTAETVEEAREEALGVTVARAGEVLR